MISIVVANTYMTAYYITYILNVFYILTPSSFLSYILLWCRFYQVVSWNTERLSNQPKVTQPKSVRAGSLTPEFTLLTTAAVIKQLEDRSLPMRREKTNTHEKLEEFVKVIYEGI